MKKISFCFSAVVLAAGLLLTHLPAAAQTCYSADDMDPSALTALRNAAENYYQSAQAGNAARLQPYADFDLAGALASGGDLLSGPAKIRSAYLLDSSTSQAGPSRTEFFCGIYNSPDRVAFIFDGLPAGRYGVVILDAAGKRPATITWILRQSGGLWRIAGLFIQSAEIAGHDAAWYLNQARAYKAKGQLHNAWLYYLTASELLRPFPAMNTPKLERLDQEMQAARPADLPGNTPMELAAAGRVFKITEMFSNPVGDGLDVVVKYQSPDISDSGKTFQDNMTVIRALVAKYPELRDAFAGVVARAVAPDGRDYGSLLAMKDVK